MTIEVRNNAAESRYEITDEGVQAGVAQYRRDGDRVVFTHTEIDDAFEGQGLGGKLARGALDDVRAQGLEVVARCQFIAGWIDRHPDYADLLASDA